MFEYLTKKMNDVLTHRVLYGALCGCHGFAAFWTAKPEVYVPICVLYAVLSWRG